jgi:hypothetical protein
LFDYITVTFEEKATVKCVDLQGKFQGHLAEEVQKCRQMKHGGPPWTIFLFVRTRATFEEKTTTKFDYLQGQLKGGKVNNADNSNTRYPNFLKSLRIDNGCRWSYSAT